MRSDFFEFVRNHGIQYVCNIGVLRGVKILEFLFGVLFGIFASIFNIGLFALNSDDTVCHCEVKENAELIAKILDFDVNGEVYQPNCENCKYYHKKFVRLSKNESDKWCPLFKSKEERK